MRVPSLDHYRWQPTTRRERLQCLSASRSTWSTSPRAPREGGGTEASDNKKPHKSNLFSAIRRYHRLEDETPGRGPVKPWEIRGGQGWRFFLWHRGTRIWRTTFATTRRISSIKEENWKKRVLTALVAMVVGWILCAADICLLLDVVRRGAVRFWFMLFVLSDESLRKCEKQ